MRKVNYRIHLICFLVNCATAIITMHPSQWGVMWFSLGCAAYNLTFATLYSREEE